LAARRQRAGWLGIGQHSVVKVNKLRAASFVSELVPVVAEAVRGDVCVHSDQASALMQRQVDHGDVAVTQDRLRVCPDGIQVDHVEITNRHPSAGMRDNRPNLRVAQQAVELVSDLLRRRGRPPATPVRGNQRRDSNTETHPLDDLHTTRQQRLLTRIQYTG
jgi:hypothetical protein